MIVAYVIFQKILTLQLVDKKIIVLIFLCRIIQTEMFPTYVQQNQIESVEGWFAIFLKRC